MHFRLGYIIRGFEFGNAQIRVSDAAKQIDVLISARSADETNPPYEPNQGIATATCRREIPKRHYDTAVSSGRLSARTEAVGRVLKDSSEIVARTVRLARWRANATQSGPDPVQWATEFSWSINGTEWRPLADTVHTQGYGYYLPPSWTGEAAAFVNTQISGELDEPLGHQLLREAATNRWENPRSSMVLAVVAAEVGFKQFASKAFPQTDWILKELPSPPLITMLRAFPWSRLGLQINGKAPSIPSRIERELKKAVLLRNQIVHVGTVDVKDETLTSVLASVRDLLYFLDALRGQGWALSCMSAEARQPLG